MAFMERVDGKMSPYGITRSFGSSGRDKHIKENDKCQWQMLPAGLGDKFLHITGQSNMYSTRTIICEAQDTSFTFAEIRRTHIQID